MKNNHNIEENDTDAVRRLLEKTSRAAYEVSEGRDNKYFETGDLLSRMIAAFDKPVREFLAEMGTSDSGKVYATTMLYVTKKTINKLERVLTGDECDCPACKLRRELMDLLPPDVKAEVEKMMKEEM